MEKPEELNEMVSQFFGFTLNHGSLVLVIF
jgi:hypothetical protein